MSAGPATAKRRAWRFGRAAEALAAGWLRLKGYRVLARDYRTPVGEVDIVARRGRTLAFVEVKARGDGVDPGPDRRQRRRIARAAEAFRAAHPGLADLDVRFDLVLVRPGSPPAHRPGAWRTDDP